MLADFAEVFVPGVFVHLPVFGFWLYWYGRNLFLAVVPSALAACTLTMFYFSEWAPRPLIGPSIDVWILFGSMWLNAIFFEFVRPKSIFDLYTKRIDDYFAPLWAAPLPINVISILAWLSCSVIRGATKEDRQVRRPSSDLYFGVAIWVAVPAFFVGMILLI